MIYALANQKGGVGKTTSTVNIAACLAEAGHRVLLDGARVSAVVIPTVVPGLELVPSGPDLAGAAVELVSRPGRDALLRIALTEVRNTYPYVFIDCSPSLDLVTINALVASTRLIVPVQCEYYALEGLSRLMETVGEVRARLNPDLVIAGLLMTMHDPRTRINGEVVQEVRRHFPGLVFDTVVPRNVRVTESPSHGEPVIRYDPHCAAADAYFEVTKEIVARG